MHQAQPEDPNYQFEKVVIILFSNAIIQIPAVVIKTRRTSVTLTTMFRS